MRYTESKSFQLEANQIDNVLNGTHFLGCHFEVELDQMQDKFDLWYAQGEIADAEYDQIEEDYNKAYNVIIAGSDINDWYPETEQEAMTEYGMTIEELELAEYRANQ